MLLAVCIHLQVRGGEPGLIKQVEQATTYVLAGGRGSGIL